MSGSSSESKPDGEGTDDTQDQSRKWERSRSNGDGHCVENRRRSSRNSSDKAQKRKVTVKTARNLQKRRRRIKFSNHGNSAAHRIAQPDPQRTSTHAGLCTPASQSILHFDQGNCVTFTRRLCINKKRCPGFVDPLPNGKIGG